MRVSGHGGTDVLPWWMGAVCVAMNDLSLSWKRGVIMGLFGSLLGFIPGCKTETIVKWNHPPTFHYDSSNLDLSDPNLAPFRTGSVTVIPYLKRINYEEYGWYLWLLAKDAQTITVHSLTATGVGDAADETARADLHKDFVLDQTLPEGKGMESIVDGFVFTNTEVDRLGAGGRISLAVEVQDPDQEASTTLHFDTVRHSHDRLVLPGW